MDDRPIPSTSWLRRLPSTGHTASGGGRTFTHGYGIGAADVETSFWIFSVVQRRLVSRAAELSWPQRLPSTARRRADLPRSGPPTTSSAPRAPVRRQSAAELASRSPTRPRRVRHCLRRRARVRARVPAAPRQSRAMRWDPPPVTHSVGHSSASAWPARDCSDFPVGVPRRRLRGFSSVANFCSFSQNRVCVRKSMCT